MEVGVVAFQLDEGSGGLVPGSIIEGVQDLSECLLGTFCGIISNVNQGSLLGSDCTGCNAGGIWFGVRG